MGPKKDDKKKGAAGAGIGAGATVTISEEELAEAKSLPPLNDFIFVNFYAFKMRRNRSRLHNVIAKQYTFTNPEEPGYTEELAAKYRVVDQGQLLAQAVARGLLTDVEAAELHTVDPERRREIFAQAAVESVTAYQLPLRQKKKEQGMAA